MSKILYLMPGRGVSKEEKLRREEIANGFLADKKKRVIVDSTEKGPISIESSIEGDLSVEGMLEKVIRERGNFDALIIGCADDPGIFSLRELLDVPVTGPFESSIAFSTMLGEQFSVITILESGFPETRMILRKYGVEQKCASIRAINYSVLDLMEKKVSKEDIINAFVRECKAAVDDGASSIILGCMSMAFMLLDEMAGDYVEVPIINPAKIAVKTSEMLLSLGLSHSRRSYPKPDMDKLGRTVFKGLF